MIEDYAFWTLAPNTEAIASVRRLIASANHVGLHKPIHIWISEPIAIDGAEVHCVTDAALNSGVPLVERLSELRSVCTAEYFVWVDPTTAFRQHPGSILHVLHGAPMHVPLTIDLASQGAHSEWRGCSCAALAAVMREAGVRNSSIYAAEHAYFIVHRAAVPALQELSVYFANRCMKAGLRVPIAALLAYAMQMLCGDVRKHVAG